MTTAPTPASMMTDLTSFRDSLPSSAPLSTLTSDLATAETALLTTYLPTDTTTYLTWIATVKWVAYKLITLLPCCS